MTLWGIEYGWYLIAALTLAALGQRVSIQLVTFWLAVPIGLLGGWTLGWTLGAERYEFLKSLNYDQWVEYGAMYKIGGGIIVAILIGVIVAFLAWPKWCAPATRKPALVSNGPQVPVQPATPPPPPAQ